MAACRTSVRAATRKTQQQTAEEAQDLGDGNGAGPRSGSTALVRASQTPTSLCECM